MIRLLLATAALLMPATAIAQTVTITGPNTVNASGQPRAVQDVFVRNADGTIASASSATPAPQGSSTAGQTGTLAQCATVTGDQAYVVGTTNPLNCIANGRLKVGLSSAGNVDPAAQLTTTLTGTLTGLLGSIINPFGAKAPNTPVMVIAREPTQGN